MCYSMSTVDSSFSLEQIQSCFQVLLHVTHASEIPNLIPLCGAHKSQLYNFHSNAKCGVCGIFFSSRSRRYLCTKLDIDNAYFQLKVNKEETAITVTSCLCYNCYCVAKRDTAPDITLDDVRQGLDFTEFDEELNHTAYALSNTCKDICRGCSSEAFLLADLYDQFLINLELQCKKDSSSPGTCYDSCKKACNSRWLLSGILNRFSNLLEVHKMIARKQSILLIYSNLDIRVALHMSYSKLRHQRRKTEKEAPMDQSDKQFFTSPGDIVSMAQYVLPQINEKLKQQSREIMEHFTQFPTQIAAFDFNSLLEMIDPLVWNCVSVLTANVDELKFIHSNELVWDSKKVMFPSYSKSHGLQRRNRRIVLVMSMQFVLSESNNYPFHIIIANCVKRLSHSSKLIRLLNHSGLCTSEDTLDRFLENIKQLRQEAGLLSTIEPTSFTVVSIDNIDVLASHAAITSTGSGRSWHGTSVMAQQPKPVTEKLSPLGELIEKSPTSSIPDFQIVPIFGDGRCLYRCIASFSRSDILFCGRNEVGIPIDSVCFQEEQQLADQIRRSVCMFLEQHINSLEGLPEGIQHVLLESSSNEFYSSFAERISDNKNPSTYAGHLEMCALACILQTDVHVYQRTVQGMKLVARYPNEQMSHYHICLLYRPGSNSLTAHFDLLYCANCRPSIEVLLDMHNIHHDTPSVNVLDTVFEKWQAAVPVLHKPNFINLVSGGMSGTRSVKSCPEHLQHHESIAETLVTSAKGSTSCDTKKEKAEASHKPSKRRQVGSSALPVPEKSHFSIPLFKTFIRQNLSLENFFPSDEEKLQEKQLHYDVFMHVAERYVSVTAKTEHTVPGLKCNLMLHSSPRCEKSKFSYIYVLNEKADCAGTVKSVVGLLYDLFKISKSVNHLVLAGDGATVKILLDVKKEYGEMLDWVVPYLGDWHILKNFQEVLMKIFWDAGLKDIAKTTHKSKTLNNLKTCSNFKRTHRFILQVYEAIYIHQLKSFLDFRVDKDSTSCSISNSSLHDTLISTVEQVHIQGDFCNYLGMEEFISKVHSNLHEFLPNFLEEFTEYCTEMSTKFETFKFWNNFLKVDCFCYIQLWTAMRTANWDMRLVALKRMGPLFHAFDRQNYSKMIPIHLCQMHGLPSYILDHFKNGAFVSSIKGVNFSSVGLDEAHEMLINKDCKTALSRSLPTNMEKIAETGGDCAVFFAVL
ncbi:uncharacterized protein LOC119732298 [Patiria miniata]|uniref:OTU domain-containing protein n=1 Tax=Patiria miniata TaxID=46514 RepID=A0A914ADX3_PATMI|nr:uncharacterized protein LOC119732298 [Patiria miniata]